MGNIGHVTLFCETLAFIIVYVILISYENIDKIEVLIRFFCVKLVLNTQEVGDILHTYKKINSADNDSSNRYLTKKILCTL